MRPPKSSLRRAADVFNGSGVRERRLSSPILRVEGVNNEASMGPASENAGYAVHLAASSRSRAASMGPASETAGYALVDVT